MRTSYDRPKSPRGYRATVEWIALNDEPCLDEPFEIADLISVQLAAFIFGKDPLDVAAAIVRLRQAEGLVS